MQTFYWRLLTLTCMAALAAATFTGPAWVKGDTDHRAARFQRFATFPVFLNTDVELETVAEIVTSTKDGKLLVYTDSEAGKVGFVDIRNPRQPLPDGTVDVSGEPTSVAVLDRHRRQYALVAVNTSESYTDPSGKLEVINICTRKVVHRIDLGGQPDSIAVSGDGRYAAVAIENERDEDLGDGRPPQAPPGFVVIVDLETQSFCSGQRGRRSRGQNSILDHHIQLDPQPSHLSHGSIGQRRGRAADSLGRALRPGCRFRLSVHGLYGL